MFHLQSFVWIFQALLNGSIAICFLLASNCYIDAYVPTLHFEWVCNWWNQMCRSLILMWLFVNFVSTIFTSWGAAYKGALSFRCSHYFVCFLSHCTMLLSGLGSIRNQKHSRVLGYTITKPWAIELPRSLVDVVVYWNLSMHYWLKTCKHFKQLWANWEQSSLRFPFHQIFLPVSFRFRCVYAIKAARNFQSHFIDLHHIVIVAWHQCEFIGRAADTRLCHICRVYNSKKDRRHFWCMRIGNGMPGTLFTSSHQSKSICYRIQFWFSHFGHGPFGVFGHFVGWLRWKTRNWTIVSWHSRALGQFRLYEPLDYHVYTWPWCFDLMRTNGRNTRKCFSTLKSIKLARVLSVIVLTFVECSPNQANILRLS